MKPKTAINLIKGQIEALDTALSEDDLLLWQAKTRLILSQIFGKESDQAKTRFDITREVPQRDGIIYTFRNDQNIPAAKNKLLMFIDHVNTFGSHVVSNRNLISHWSNGQILSGLTGLSVLVVPATIWFTHLFYSHKIGSLETEVRQYQDTIRLSIPAPQPVFVPDNKTNNSNNSTIEAEKKKP